MEEAAAGDSASEAPGSEPAQHQSAQRQPDQLPPAHRPLAGVVVVDLSRHLPGPLVSRLLGDLGARVIKVEEPRHGDPVRQAPPLVGSGSSLASILLAGHESVALDLKQDGGREVLESLLLRADVLVESFRPGTLRRFGLAPEELQQRYPRLIICSVSGWGQQGPLAGRAGHDITYQALAGTLATTSSVSAVPLADLTGAWSGVATVLAALYRRQREPNAAAGCWIDQALLDAAGHSAITALAAEADGPRPAGQAHGLSGALPCYRVYRTRDQAWLALGLLEPPLWRRFCAALGREDLRPLQYSEEAEAHATMEALFLQRDRSAWAQLMAEHDLPGEALLSLSEAREHPQVKARALLRQAADGTLRLAYPAVVDGQRPVAAEEVPELGQHTERWLEELGHPTPRLWQRRSGVGRSGGLGRRLRRLAVRWWQRRR